MIFLTVGTTKFPFNRLLEVVDKSLANLDFQEDLIVQAGTSSYQFKYRKIRLFKEIPFDKMIAYFKEARVVIAHGGPATIFLALKYGLNKPIIISRLSSFGEHVNNHQEIFTESLGKKGMIMEILSQKDLKNKINAYLKKPVVLKKARNIKADDKLIKKLINYTKSIQ